MQQTEQHIEVSRSLGPAGASFVCFDLPTKPSEAWLAGQSFATPHSWIITTPWSTEVVISQERNEARIALANAAKSEIRKVRGTIKELNKRLMDLEDKEKLSANGAEKLQVCWEIDSIHSKLQWLEQSLPPTTRPFQAIMELSPKSRAEDLDQVQEWIWRARLTVDDPVHIDPLRCVKLTVIPPYFRGLRQRRNNEFMEIMKRLFETYVDWLAEGRPLKRNREGIVRAIIEPFPKAATVGHLEAFVYYPNLTSDEIDAEIRTFERHWLRLCQSKFGKKLEFLGKNGQPGQPVSARRILGLDGRDGFDGAILYTHEKSKHSVVDQMGSIGSRRFQRGMDRLEPAPEAQVRKVTPLQALAVRAAGIKQKNFRDPGDFRNLKFYGEQLSSSDTLADEMAQLDPTCLELANLGHMVIEVSKTGQETLKVRESFHYWGDWEVQCNRPDYAQAVHDLERLRQIEKSQCIESYTSAIDRIGFELRRPGVRLPHIARTRTVTHHVTKENQHTLIADEVRSYHIQLTQGRAPP